MLGATVFNRGVNVLKHLAGGSLHEACHHKITAQPIDSGSSSHRPSNPNPCTVLTQPTQQSSVIGKSATAGMLCLSLVIEKSAARLPAGNLSSPNLPLAQGVIGHRSLPRLPANQKKKKKKKPGCCPGVLSSDLQLTLALLFIRFVSAPSTVHCYTMWVQRLCIPNI